MITTEKRFEADIESFFLSPAGGYTKGADTYDAKQGLYVNTMIDFVQRTQPKEWARFENANQVDPVRKFCTAFNTACETEGLLSVLRHGFKHRGLRFRVCYFKPESARIRRRLPSGRQTPSSAIVNGTSPPIQKRAWIWCWCSTASRYSLLN